MPLATLVLSLVVRVESGELESTLAMLPLPGSATVSVHHLFATALAIDDVRGGERTAVLMNLAKRIVHETSFAHAQ